MDESSKKIEIVGELKKLSMTKDDVLVLSFKDPELYRRFLKNGNSKALYNMFKRAFGGDVGIVTLPPGIELGVIEKKEIAPWKAYNDFTGDLGIEIKE